MGRKQLWLIQLWGLTLLFGAPFSAHAVEPTGEILDEPVVDASRVTKDWRQQLRDETEKYRTRNTFVVTGLVNEEHFNADGTATPFASYLRSEFAPGTEYPVVISYREPEGFILLADDRIPLSSGSTTHSGAKASQGEWQTFVDKLNKDKKPSLEMKFSLLERQINNDLAAQKKVAFILDKAENIIPKELKAGRQDSKTVDVIAQIFQRWSENSNWTRQGFRSFFISTEAIDSRVARQKRTGVIRVNYPSGEEKLEFLKQFQMRFAHDEAKLKLLTTLPPEHFQHLTLGMTLTDLDMYLHQRWALDLPIDADSLKELRKYIITQNFGDMVEIVESDVTFNDVVGNDHIKWKLKKYADAMISGQGKNMAPGVLIAGPQGAGKSFVVDAFSNETGIPVVKLKNLQNKFVGESEANLERLFSFLKSLGNVGVYLDEADTVLSYSDNDSTGIKKYFFGQFMQFMQEQKGKVMWILATARPEGLRNDVLTRLDSQVIFYPMSAEEKKAIFLSSLRRGKHLEQYRRELKEIGGKLRLGGGDFFDRLPENPRLIDRIVGSAFLDVAHPPYSTDAGKIKTPYLSALEDMVKYKVDHLDSRALDETNLVGIRHVGDLREAPPWATKYLRDDAGKARLDELFKVVRGPGFGAGGRALNAVERAELFAPSFAPCAADYAALGLVDGGLGI